jgi:hypothetical protein
MNGLSPTVWVGMRLRYDGDIRARDAAYHQGTMWAWLIDPFIDAWLRVYPGIIRERVVFLPGSTNISARPASVRSAKSLMPMNHIPARMYSSSVERGRSIAMLVEDGALSCV